MTPSINIDRFQAEITRQLPQEHDTATDVLQHLHSEGILISKRTLRARLK